MEIVVFSLFSTIKSVTFQARTESFFVCFLFFFIVFKFQLEKVIIQIKNALHMHSLIFLNIEDIS